MTFLLVLPCSFLLFALWLLLLRLLSRLPPVFPPLSAHLPSALTPAPAPLPLYSFPSAFLFPPASTPLSSAPPLGFSTPSVSPPPGFPSVFSALPSVPVISSLASAVPPPVIPSTFSAPSSLSAHPSAPSFLAYSAVAALAVPDAASEVPAAAQVLFRPFAVSVSVEAPVAPSGFTSAPLFTSAVPLPGFPSGSSALFGSFRFRICCFSG